MTGSVSKLSDIRFQLWFGIFGGAVAWLLHLLCAAMISEWACVSGVGRGQFLGVSGVSWWLIVVSGVALMSAAGVTWMSYRVNRICRHSAVTDQQIDPHNHQGTNVFMSEIGLWANALFVFIILAESVPILFYLAEC